MQQVAAPGGPFDEHFLLAADQRHALGPRDAPHHRDEPLEPLRLELLGDVVLDADGGRPLAHRVLEGERVVEVHVLDQRQRLGEVDFRFAGETHDDVGREGQAGDGGPQGRHPLIRLTRYRAPQNAALDRANRGAALSISDTEPAADGLRVTPTSIVTTAARPAGKP